MGIDVKVEMEVVPCVVLNPWVESKAHRNDNEPLRYINEPYITLRYSYGFQLVVNTLGMCIWPG